MQTSPEVFSARGQDGDRRTKWAGRSWRPGSSGHSRQEGRSTWWWPACGHELAETEHS